VTTEDSTATRAVAGRHDLGDWWDWMRDWWYDMDTNTDPAEDDSFEAGPSTEFLGFGHEACLDIMTIEIAPDFEAVIKPFEYYSFSVSSNEIQWQCDGEPRPALDCPETTNLVQIDRRLASTVFTFTCFHQ
jgi:hypothetical protein